MNVCVAPLQTKTHFAIILLEAVRGSKILQKTKGLKVLHLNVHNFVKLDEIFTSFQNIDIFGGTETHINEDISSNVKIRGFKYIDKPRTNGAGGGVGVYISERIQFIRRFDLENDLIECLWLQISYPNTKGFLIGIIY